MIAVELREGVRIPGCFEQQFVTKLEVNKEAVEVGELGLSQA